MRIGVLVGSLGFDHLKFLELSRLGESLLGVLLTPLVFLIVPWLVLIVLIVATAPASVVPAIRLCFIVLVLIPTVVVESTSRVAALVTALVVAVVAASASIV